MRSTTLVVSADQARHLEAIIARHISPQRLVLRASLVLLVAAGHPIRAAARRRGCRPSTVRKWCRRFAADGVAGLADASRPGRPRRITPRNAVRSSPPPAQRQKITAWRGFGVERNIAGARRHRLRPGRTHQCPKRATHPQVGLHQTPSLCLLEAPHRPDFDVKMRPIVELYVNPPADGPVVCADEKTCIQALQCRHPDLPIRRPGELSRREVEYTRHGTRCLTAGLFVHSGEIFGILTEIRPRDVFLAFLDLLDTKVPDGQVIHLIVDKPEHTPRRAH